MLSPMMAVSGSRLAYVAVPVKAKKLMRNKVTFEKGKGLVNEQYEVKGQTYMVYFPRGHSLHLTEKEMRRFKYKGFPLTRKPEIVNLQGLSDPNSPLGQIMMQDDKNAQAAGWRELEAMTKRLATARTGPNLLTELAPVPEFATPDE